MILGVQWVLIVTNNTNNGAFKQKNKQVKNILNCNVITCDVS